MEYKFTAHRSGIVEVICDYYVSYYSTTAHFYSRCYDTPLPQLKNGSKGKPQIRFESGLVDNLMRILHTMYSELLPLQEYVVDADSCCGRFSELLDKNYTHSCSMLMLELYQKTAADVELLKHSVFFVSNISELAQEFLQKVYENFLIQFAIYLANMRIVLCDTKKTISDKMLQAFLRDRFADEMRHIIEKIN